MATVTGVGGRSRKTTARSWHEEDGIIYFSVVSDATTGAHWIKRSEYNGYRLGNDAKAILRSPAFRPTSHVRTSVAVIKGTLFEEKDRTTANVRAFAKKRKFENIDPEVICLIREKFLDKDLAAMGLFWLIGMHNPVDVEGDPRLLGADRIEDRDGYGSFMVAYRGQVTATWDRDTGFVFKVFSRQCHLEAV